MGIWGYAGFRVYGAMEAAGLRLRAWGYRYKVQVLGLRI